MYHCRRITKQTLSSCSVAASWKAAGTACPRPFRGGREAHGQRVEPLVERLWVLQSDGVDPASHESARADGQRLSALERCLRQGRLQAVAAATADAAADRGRPAQPAAVPGEIAARPSGARASDLVGPS
eukprot:3558031-Prymnesium_polylepis.1